MNHSPTVLAAVALIERANAAIERTRTAADLLHEERKRIAAVPMGRGDMVAHLHDGLAAFTVDFETALSRHLDTNQVAQTGLWGADPAAVAIYFLRDNIAAQIPALVDQLCPKAETGLTPGARKKANSSVIEGFSQLVMEADSLIRELNEGVVAFRSARQTAWHAGQRNERNAIELQLFDLEKVIEAAKQAKDYVAQLRTAR